MGYPSGLSSETTQIPPGSLIITHIRCILLAFTAASLLTACPGWGVVHDDPFASDTGIIQEGPRLILSPSTISFDVTTGDGPVVRSTTAQNLGDATLSLWDFQPPEGGPFRLVSPTDVLVSLKPKESITLDYEFTPPYGGEFEQPIRLQSNDSEKAHDLLLQGVASGPKVTATTPATMTAKQLCTATSKFDLRNQGTAPFEIGPPQWKDQGAGVGCEPFRLITTDVTRIDENDFRAFEVEFTPSISGDASCLLQFPGNLNAPVSVNLFGTGRPNDLESANGQLSLGHVANVLVLLDLEGTSPASVNKLVDGLPQLLDRLHAEDVSYRVAALSTEADEITSGSTYVLPGQTDGQTSDLKSNLLTEGDRDADHPFERMVDVLAGTGPALGGWLRRSDVVHVIIVSDRDDASGNSVTYWVDEARSEVPKLVISTIAPGESCSSGTTLTPRLQSATLQTGGRAFDICDDVWDATWVTLGSETASMRDPLLEFPLPADTRANAIRVEVETDPGLQQTSAWSWSSPVLTLLPDEAAVPFVDGGQVRIQYVTEDSCR